MRFDPSTIALFGVKGSAKQYTPEAGCVMLASETFFVWEAMAKGAFKFFAQYLPVPTEACAPATSWAATITAQFIRWFTALVVVWYVVSFAKAWYQRLRRAKASNSASP